MGLEMRCASELAGFANDPPLVTTSLLAIASSQLYSVLQLNNERMLT